MNQPLFEPNFLNLEYFFNLIVRPFGWLADLLAYFAGLEGGAASPFLRNLLLIMAVLIAFGIVYASYKYWKLREEEKEKYGEAKWEAMEAVDHTERNKRWEKVLDDLDSPNESEWRLAILESDAILDEMLDKMGYVGDTIGEKLKGVEASDFNTISEAWEAHKVRNQIAHEAGEFRITKREAERIIDLYRQVFEEFHYI